MSMSNTCEHRHVVLALYVDGDYEVTAIQGCANMRLALDAMMEQPEVVHCEGMTTRVSHFIAWMEKGQ